MNIFYKKIYLFSALGLGMLLAGVLATSVRAATIDTVGVTYPIAELGNCVDQAACAIYCDKTDNMSACVDYAAKNNLMDKNEAALAKKAIAKIQAGQTPGSCTSQASCQSYCQNNMDSLNSCIAFAEEIGISDAEIEQAKKIAVALKNGATMPGNCGGKQSCEAYCQETSHIDECLTFAEAAQILPAEEIAEAKKVAPFLKSGQTPGGCKSKTDCKAYCDQENNFSECINFAEQAGFVSNEEATIAKKTGGQGPGGCKSKQVCEAYCNLPANAKACGDFALEKGLVDEKTAERIKSGYKEIQAGLEKAPPEIRPDVESCLNNLFNGNLSSVLSGEQAITQVQGDKIGGCFEAAAKKYADEQMKNAPGAASVNGTGISGQGINSTEAEKSLDNAPAEIKAQVQAEIERQKQKAMEDAIKQNTQSNMPAGLPAGIPTNIPANPPTDMPSNMPANIPADLPLPQTQVPPAGLQGPPCNTPAECQAMFGGGGPAAGVPVQ